MMSGRKVGWVAVVVCVALVLAVRAVHACDVHKGLCYERARMPAVRRGELPARVDLSEGLPPVVAQGDRVSCTAFATGYYLKGYQEWVKSGVVHEFSPSYVYNQRRAMDCWTDRGMSIADAGRVLRDEGCALWSEFPYVPHDPCVQPSEAVRRDALPFAIGEYGMIEGVEAMKRALAEGMPVVVSVVVYEPCWDVSEIDCVVRVPDPAGGDVLSCGHVVLLCGYDDELEAFRFVNSWGEEWGCGGFGWMPYGHDVHEAWVFEDVANEYRVYLPMVGGLGREIFSNERANTWVLTYSGR